MRNEKHIRVQINHLKTLKKRFLNFAAESEETKSDDLRHLSDKIRLLEWVLEERSTVNGRE